MPYVFCEAKPNFPKDDAELKERLAGVEKFINPAEEIPKVNVQFVLAAGKLMEDCGLIAENNLRFLCAATACQNFNPDFKFPFNPAEGALRAVDDDGNIFGADNLPRFYHGRKRRLELLNGQHYLFSNDWYPSNKRQFFLWLAVNARKNCETFWSRRVSSKSPGDDEKITIEITDELQPKGKPVTVDKPDDFAKVIELLKILHAKVDDLTVAVEELKTLHAKVDALTVEVEELKTLHAKVDKLTAKVEELDLY